MIFDQTVMFLCSLRLLLFFSFTFFLVGWNVLFFYLKELSDDESSVGSSVGAGDSEPCQPKSTTSRDEINVLERRVKIGKAHV